MRTPFVLAAFILAASSAAACTLASAKTADPPGEPGPASPEADGSVLPDMPSSTPPASGSTDPFDAGTLPDGATTGSHDAAAPTGAFTPSTLPGLALWLRSDEGLATNANGIVTWTDQSSAHTAFSTQPFFRPPPFCTRTFVAASVLAGHPALNVQCSDSLGGPAPASAGTGPVLFLTVISGLGDTTSTGRSLFGWRRYDDTFGVFQDVWSVAGGRAFGLEASGGPGFTGTHTVGASASYAATGHIVGFQRDATSLTTLRLDGAADTARTFTAPFESPALFQIYNGALVSEIVVVTGNVTPAQVGQLEAYLRTKYVL